MLNDLQNELDGYQKSVKFIINNHRSGYLKNILRHGCELVYGRTEFVVAMRLRLADNTKYCNHTEMMQGCHHM
jgi:hypothetical protein